LVLQLKKAVKKYRSPPLEVKQGKENFFSRGERARSFADTREKKN
jgi:hypothetical protein